MSRSAIEYPKSQDDWNNLPKEFNDYLSVLDQARQNKAESIPVDPLYPSYDYEWELDDEIPFNIILMYWNDVNKELPDSDKLLDDINDSLAESAYDDYVGSYYSY